jgi:hypothetical protein
MAIEELKFCDEQGKNPTELIQECLAELEERGFVNLVGNQVKQYAVQIRDQKSKLKMFISEEFKSGRNINKKGGSNSMHFDQIYKTVCQ